MLVVLLLVIGGAATWFLVDRDVAKETTSPAEVLSDAERFHQDYPGVAADHVFQTVNDEEVLELFQSGTGVVFLGFKECPWCQKLAPLVEAAAKAEGLETVYYYDVRNARQDGTATYQKLVDHLREYLTLDESGQPRIFVPDVSFLREGEIVGRYEQATADDGANTPDTYWTAPRQVAAQEQLQEKIKEMVAQPQ